MTENLPNLSEKQSLCLELFWTNGKNKTEAWRDVYGKNCNTATCCVEASRFFKNPNITPWLEYYEKTRQEYIQKKIEYSVDDAFNECEELKIIALESTGKDGKPNVAGAIKAVEMKVKLKGLLSDDVNLNNAITVQMGNVEIDGSNLELKVGEEVDNGEQNKN